MFLVPAAKMINYSLTSILVKKAQPPTSPGPKKCESDEDKVSQ